MNEINLNNKYKKYKNGKIIQKTIFSHSLVPYFPVCEISNGTSATSTDNTVDKCHAFPDCQSGRSTKLCRSLTSLFEDGNAQQRITGQGNKNGVGHFDTQCQKG